MQSRFRAPAAGLRGRSARWLLIGLSLACAAGCQQMGPAAIMRARYNYNGAIQQTAKEQLLLNLLRVRRDDTPLFLDITKVAAQIQFQGNLSGSAFLPQVMPPGHDFEVNGGLAYTETPTVEYQPLQGEALVKQVLSPISLESLVSLYDSNWDLRLILSLALDRLTPQSNLFDRAVRDLSRLDELGALDLAIKRSNGLGPAGPSRDDSGPGPDLLVLMIDTYNTAPADRSEAEQVLEDLNSMFAAPATQPTTQPADTRPSTPPAKGPATRPSPHVIQFQLSGVAARHRQIVNAIRTRSPLGVLAYVGRRAVFAKPGQSIPGSGLMTIRHTPGPVPGPAYVSAFYRGEWYYIDDEDADSRRTFALLAQFVTMQAAPLQNTGILLTLPLGGR